MGIIMVYQSLADESCIILGRDECWRDEGRQNIRHEAQKGVRRERDASCYRLILSTQDTKVRWIENRTERERENPTFLCTRTHTIIRNSTQAYVRKSLSLSIALAPMKD